MNNRRKRIWSLTAACICSVILVLSFSPEAAMCFEEGQPEEGVDWIVAVGPDGESYVIDEYRYETTTLTRYYKQNGMSTNPDRFIPGVLVEFVADEEGRLISLREEYDFGGEFARKRGMQPGSVDEQTEQPVKKKTRPADFNLHKEGGVWKN